MIKDLYFHGEMILDDVKMEAEIGVIYPQAKYARSHQKLEEATAVKPRVCGESVTHLAPWFWTSVRTIREYISVVLSHQICDNLLQQP